MAAAIVLAVVSAIGVGVRWLADDTATGGAESAVPAGPPGAQVAGATVSVAADPLLALHWDGESPSVRLIDAGTGTTVATVPTEYNPWVLLRRGANELLVSDNPMVDDGRGGAALAPRMRILDMDTLELKHEIALPQRATYTVYAQGMALSQDERFLFYLAHSYRDELAECRSGGDAAVCDRHSVGLVDLASPSAPPAMFELPAGCGWPSLTLSGADGVLALCSQSGVVTRIGASGEATIGTPVSPGARPMEAEAPIARNVSTARLAVPLPEGGVAVAFEDGTLVLSEGGRAVRIAPEGKRIFGAPSAAAVAGDYLAIAYASSFADTRAEGIAIVNLRDLRIVADVPVRDLVSIAAASEGGATEIVALSANGAIHVIDPATGSVRTVATSIRGADGSVLVGS